MPFHIQQSSFLFVLFLFTNCLSPHSSATAAFPQVYRAEITPHWFSKSTKFWYRNQTDKAKFEFILVDSQSGTRERAFDHEKVADQLSADLNRTVQADAIPIRDLEFSESDNTIQLSGKYGVWKYHRKTRQITRTSDKPISKPQSIFFLPPRKSSNKGDDVDFKIVNELNEPVHLLWINRSGSPVQYATLEPNETRIQHSYPGHVWLIQNRQKQAMACFEVPKNMAPIVIRYELLPQLHSSKRKRPSSTAWKSALSPNQQYRVVERNHDLWRVNQQTNEAIQLTTDGTVENSFRKSTVRNRIVEMEYHREDPEPGRVDVVWSKDSEHLLAWQTTRVPEPRVTIVESTPKNSLLPHVHQYPYARAGDIIPTRTPRIFNIKNGTEIPIDDLTQFDSQWSLDFVNWNDTHTAVRLLYNARGHQIIKLIEIDVTTGETRTLIDEHSDTFIHYSTDGKNVLEPLPDEQILWSSERSGWNHLYRISAKTGKLINAVTQGEWNVRRIKHIDSHNKRIFFDAVGITDGEDPYHQHLCCVDFDGNNFQQLTSGDGTHTVSWAPNRATFIDQYSRVDLPPVTKLCRADGTLICKLEQADASEVITAYGAFPERFHAPGRDGKTEIWGIIHRPRDFDPAKRLPIVENIYAGPHDHHVPKSFRGSWRHQRKIADAGFIVVQIDGMGTAWRSKEFHDVCYQNLRDAGFPDRIAWIKALAKKYPNIDINRVGIYGGSAGGQNAMAALLWHHDFYKVAVADCGCHDNRIDKIWWNEQWMGWPVGDQYFRSSNMENAHLLKGDLMLTVGELDRNVDPASTYQVVKKLIDAKKEFQFLLIPGVGHGAGEREWASKQRTQFFVDKLKTN